MPRCRTCGAASCTGGRPRFWRGKPRPWSRLPSTCSPPRPWAMRAPSTSCGPRPTKRWRATRRRSPRGCSARALAEGPVRSPDPELLAALGQAELAAGLPTAVERLEEAIKTRDRSRTPQRSWRSYSDARCTARAATRRPPTYSLPRWPSSTQPDSPSAAELEAAYIAAATFVPALRQRARARGEAMLGRVGADPTSVQRVAIAHLAIQSALRNENRAEVARIAELAWGDGELLAAEGGEGMIWPLVAGALLFVDELERSLEICDAAVQSESPSTSAPRVSAAASYCRAWSLYHRAHITDALAEAQASVAAGSEGWYDGGLSAYGAIAACQLQRGELDQAERTLVDPRSAGGCRRRRASGPARRTRAATARADPAARCTRRRDRGRPPLPARPRRRRPWRARLALDGGARPPRARRARRRDAAGSVRSWSSLVAAA